MAAGSRLRVLHAIHDFLPRHRAGSEFYARDLCRELIQRHHVTLLAAEYDPARRHGHVTWRVESGLPVVELVNNWPGREFEDTYRSPFITEQLGHLLDAVQPDVVHLHSLFNLSFDLPALVHGRGVPVVATLHDYTLVCPSGGQRVHRAEDHVCETIEPARCARCFRESPFHAQSGVGNLMAVGGIGLPLKHAAAFVRHRLPTLAAGLARALARTNGARVDEAAIARRLEHARTVFEEVDLFVAPSQSMACEYERLGVSQSKLRVLRHGFVPLDEVPRQPRQARLRIGFVGTLVWHKGVHALIDAVRALSSDEYELLIYGDLATFPDYVEDLRRRADGLPVRFMGEFDRDSVSTAYAAIDVIVVPSIWPENAPLVVHEAFMAGVPVVAARTGGLPEVVDDGVNGVLYDPQSIEALASALRTFVEDPARLETLARGIPAIKSMDAHAREWEAIYFELLGASCGRSGPPPKA